MGAPAAASPLAAPARAAQELRAAPRHDGFCEGSPAPRRALDFATAPSLPRSAPALGAPSTVCPSDATLRLAC
eukprot:8098645-Alexandrium_andersonii.AAC.1